MDLINAKYRVTQVCPKCNSHMGWAGQSSDTPYLVDYHCDGIYSEEKDKRIGGCGYKGTYDWHQLEWDEYSATDYVISDNTTLQQAIERAAELGCHIENNDE